MTGPTTPDVQDNAPVPVSVREIESQLDSAWENMQREAVKIGAAVTRASMSNVIIVCGHRDQIEDLTESIALLVVRHPARVLLLAAGADRGQPVLAEVYAHCRRLGDGIQLCCEHILVELYVEDVDRVASVVRPLLIGDLPTALWWAGTGPPTSTGALFDTLADLSDQVIYDRVGWPDPARGVQAMARWVKSRRQTVFNLAWRRLKPWRRIIAQVLDPAVAPGALRQIDSVEIVHGPHALSMAWLLIGWLAARLDWVADQGRVRSMSEVGWGFRTESGPVRIAIRRSDEGEPSIETLRVSWHDPGHSGRASFSAEGQARIRVLPEESTLAPAVIPYGTPSLAAMVASQLAHRERDPSFGDALTVAETMAGVLR